MANLCLSLAISPYDRIRPLINGLVKPEGITLEYTDLPAPDIFYRQSKFSQFDVSEMSFSAYLIARAKGWGYQMLPIFHNRDFFYTSILVRRSSGITKPQDLKGKRFGIAEYAMSMGLWTRGILQHEFDVHPSEIQWYQERPPNFSHARSAGFEPPPGIQLNYTRTDLASMMLENELDAALILSGSSLDRPKRDISRHPDIKPLFTDYRKEGIRYYKKTKVYPPQHVTIVRESIIKEHPWVATSLLKAFEQAKTMCLDQLYQSYMDGPPSMLVFARSDLREQRRVFGDDPYIYGIKANAKAIDMVQTFSVEQGLTHDKQQWDKLFPEEIMLAEEKLHY